MGYGLEKEHCAGLPSRKSCSVGKSSGLRALVFGIRVMALTSGSRIPKRDARQKSGIAFRDVSYVEVQTFNDFAVVGRRDSGKAGQGWAEEENGSSKSLLQGKKMSLEADGQFAETEQGRGSQARLSSRHVATRSC
jgi:hypothetical protein